MKNLKDNSNSFETVKIRDDCFKLGSKKKKKSINKKNYKETPLDVSGI